MSIAQALSMPGPSRLTRPSQDIIDVDSLPDDDEVVFTGWRQRPRQEASMTSTEGSAASLSRTNSTIYVPDSDEEDAAMPGRFTGVSRRHRLFSPPPPVVNHPIPPVPPIPRRFANAGYRAHSGQHPPVIVPNVDPFSFEVNLEHRPQPAAPPPVLPPRGAPRSHHQPAMGLGGALIALNRQHQVQDENRQQRAAQQAASRRTHRFFPLPHFAAALWDYLGAREDNEPVEFHDYGDFLEPAWDNHWEAAEWLPEFGQPSDGPKRSSKQPAWLPSYTHPGDPEPGFSFDFEPKVAKRSSPEVIVLDDDVPDASSQAGSSTSASAHTGAAPVLVCARCLDPLVLQGSESAPLPLEESRRRRNWALRCGHMLDGKCIQAIMRPDLPNPLEAKASSAGDVESLESVLQEELTEEAVINRSTGNDKAPGDVATGKRKREVIDDLPDRKGKGKAVDRGSLGPTVGEQAGHTPDLSASTLMVDAPSIRSRLRPRPSHTSISASSVAPPVGPEQLPEVSRFARPLPQRRGGTSARAGVTSPKKSKGKGRARKPVVEARHAWFCPVAGCCREHGSVRMRGEEEWKMDDNIGAIALFV